MPVLLELFSGTGSVGKVAKKMGFKVISVDNEEKFKPDILQDISKWNFKSDKRLPSKIDYIWASPPCVSFSLLNNAMKTPHRKADLKPLTETGRLGNKLLNKTISIINYYRSKNPNLKFAIENPRGYMRKMPAMKKLPRTTTSYSQYGFNYNKPTDFWTNFKLVLKPVDTSKNPSAMKKAGKMAEGGAQGQSRETLYRIPGPLMRSILTQMKKGGEPTEDQKNHKEDKKPKLAKNHIPGGSGMCP
tara:strand:- start:821 stop:1555 length:735 start_codon:yes stop_codon:yes gene_type:complete